METVRILGDESNHVKVHEIRWTLVPEPTIEQVSVDGLLALPDTALVAYCHELQIELDSVRDLLHQTVAALALASAQRDRAVRLVRELQRRLPRPPESRAA